MDVIKEIRRFHRVPRFVFKIPSYSLMRVTSMTDIGTQRYRTNLLVLSV